MRDVDGAAINRLMADGMTPEEQRRLAQAALDDPDLFDALTAAGIVTASVTTDARGEIQSPPRASDVPRTAPPASNRSQRLLWTGALGAAAAVLLAMWLTRPPNGPASPGGTSSIGSGAASGATPPASAVTGTRPPGATPSAGAPPAGSSAASVVPELLYARLAPESTAAFRTGGSDARDPRASGSIVSVADGEADIDLGAVDGLTRGSQLRIAGTGGAAMLTVTTVFRDRARGTVAPADGARPGDRIDVPATLNVEALLNEAEARQSAGDLAGSRSLAEQAVSRAQQTGFPAPLARRALERLGTIEHQGGALDSAAGRLQAAVAAFDTAPAATADERAQVLNELGAIQIAQRDYAAAEQSLVEAEKSATGTTGIFVANNLAALAASRGDRAEAERLYRRALDLATGPGAATARAAIQRNLNQLASVS
jgi:hypothetical protein